MDFAETTKYLLSLGNEVEAMKLGLENISRLLATLGDPQKNYLKVQVAGTNGKGSVCAFLNSICLQAGIRTGMFTSPHLISVTERVKIDGVNISENEFARLATRARETSEKLVADGELEAMPTFFEHVTAIALLAFAEAKVELAVLETGLGGRFDAVTAARAEICAITRIDYDHQRHLGDTLEEIAAEKAAIICAESQVVVGDQDVVAMGAVLERCRQTGVEPRLANEISATRGGNTTGRECVEFRLKAAHSLPLVFLPACVGLAGNHQIENAKVAIMIADELGKKLPISMRGVVAGLESARHPGRLEWIGRYLLDGAHNVGGARALLAYLDEFVSQPITLIFGAMREKNVAEMAEILWPRAGHIILTRPENSRAMTEEELAEFTPPDVDREKVYLTGSVREALEKANAVSTGDSIILVTGSLYLVGEIRRALI